MLLASLRWRGNADQLKALLSGWRQSSW